MAFDPTLFVLGLCVSGGLNTPGGTTDTIVIDFKNGVYTVNGDASTIGTLTEQDAVNWNSYDPADVIPGSGYPSLGEGPVLKGAAKDAVLAGATVVIDFTLTHDDKFIMEVFEENFDTDYQWVCKIVPPSVFMRYVDVDNFSNYTTTISDGPHKLAFTQSYDEMSWSFDGGAAQTLTSAAADPAPTIVGLYLDGGNAATFLRSVTIMPIQPVASLPTLSTL